MGNLWETNGCLDASLGWAGWLDGWAGWLAGWAGWLGWAAGCAGRGWHGWLAQLSLAELGWLG